MPAFATPPELCCARATQSATSTPRAAPRSTRSGEATLRSPRSSVRSGRWPTSEARRTRRKRSAGWVTLRRAFERKLGEPRGCSARPTTRWRQRRRNSRSFDSHSLLDETTNLLVLGKRQRASVSFAHFVAAAETTEHVGTG